MITEYGETFWFEVLIWEENDGGGGEFLIGFIEAFTKAHAELELRNGIMAGKYPKGAWIERNRETDGLAVECGHTASRYPATVVGA